MLDIVVNDLAAQYAVATEAAFGAALIATANVVELAPVAAGGTPTAVELAQALWTAAANVYNAVKGQGRLALAVSPASWARGGRCSLR